MNFVALKMLVGDRAKYLGLVFAIAFSTFLLENQVSIFSGIMKRTTSQILDVHDASIWVMDPQTQYFDEVSPLTPNDLYKVRGTPGVRWAVPLYKGQPRAESADGKFRAVILLGLDDTTLVGAPQRMILGSVERLREPDAVIIDLAGYRFFFPTGPLEVGRVLEMNDRRARIVGIADASAPFATFPVLFTRYSQALRFGPPERNQLSFVLVSPEAHVDAPTLRQRVRERTGLYAATTGEFAWRTIGYYLRNTGIPVNFGITIAIALVVGAVVAGQTFYLFTLDNLKHFGALKAIGVTDARIVGMILLQAVTVAALGFSLGTGLCAAFFELTLQRLPMRGIVLMWQAAAGTGAVIFAIVALASLLSVRRVLVLEPAAVFRG
jgi:putative ABC transport system permease protein